LIFHEVTDKNKLAPFFMAHGVNDLLPRHLACCCTLTCLGLKVRS